ncbi:CopG family transcriptional regulator [Acetobacteraceae bacterium]|nr:CopG family transcriptional regulator [Acetobacteraceae bacterium]
MLEKLEEMEDFYLAEKISSCVHEGKEKTIPLEEIMKRYDLEN